MRGIFRRRAVVTEAIAVPVSLETWPYIGGSTFPILKGTNNGTFFPAVRPAQEFAPASLVMEGNDKEGFSVSLLYYGLSHEKRERETVPTRVHAKAWHDATGNRLIKVREECDVLDSQKAERELVVEGISRDQAEMIMNLWNSCAYSKGLKVFQGIKDTPNSVYQPAMPNNEDVVWKFVDALLARRPDLEAVEPAAP